MNNRDALQTILLKCEAEIANGHQRPASAGTLADEILSIIDAAGKETVALPRTFGKGLARLERDRPLVVLDLETTSADIDQAKIIEIAAVKINVDGSREVFNTLVNPGFDISPEVAELTGIKNEDLEAALPFSHYAPALLEFLSCCDVGGFNIRNFDAPVLYEEFYALGHIWEIKQSEIIDAMEIFFKMEPRSLSGAVSFYLDGDHSGAHRALPDVEATISVLDAQLAKYQGLPDDLQALIAETKRDNRIDMAGKFIFHNGVPCFGFGKHGPADGKEPTPCHEQIGYIKWMLDQRFPNNTKEIAEAILKQARPGRAGN